MTACCLERTDGVTLRLASRDSNTFTRFSHCASPPPRPRQRLSVYSLRHCSWQRPLPFALALLPQTPPQHSLPFLHSSRFYNFVVRRQGSTLELDKV